MGRKLFMKKIPTVVPELLQRMTEINRKAMRINMEEQDKKLLEDTKSELKGYRNVLGPALSDLTRLKMRMNPLKELVNLLKREHRAGVIGERSFPYEYLGRTIDKILDYDKDGEPKFVVLSLTSGDYQAQQYFGTNARAQEYIIAKRGSAESEVLYLYTAMMEELEELLDEARQIRMMG